MVEMTQTDNVILGLAIAIPAFIGLILMIIDNIHSYRERKRVPIVRKRRKKEN